MSHAEKSCARCGKLFWPERASRQFCSQPCSGSSNARLAAAVSNSGPNAKSNKQRKRAVFARDFRSIYASAK